VKFYSLAIDAGGTKTLGLLVCSKTGESWQAKDKGASLSHNIDDACETILGVINQLVEASGCDLAEVNGVCGAAGAGNEKSRNRLLGMLPKEFNNFLVTTDARTSLYGSALGCPIIVVAIGTGTVAMRLDADGVEKQFGGWGFTAGDLGGGAFIGRELVKAALKQFDSDNPIPSTLLDETLIKLGSNKQKILHWIKTSTPTMFAEFSPTVFAAIENDSIAQNIINKTANEVEQLVLLARGNSKLSVVLLGGRCDVIRPHLSQKIQDILISAKGDALTGALYLADQL